MGVSRREFLKIGGIVAVSSSLESFSPQNAEANQRKNRLKDAKITTSICPYCAVGCGMLVYSKNKKVINIEGDPEHPINRGNLCSKGASLLQMAHNPARVVKPLYRASGAKNWKEVEWDWAVKEIAIRIKKTRDKSFVRQNKKNQEVNRCDAIASVGSAALDNEECYIYQKWLRSLGLVSIEHQARI
jgi:formate dehydrogenase major subunit